MGSRRARLSRPPRPCLGVEDIFERLRSDSDGVHRPRLKLTSYGNMNAQRNIRPLAFLKDGNLLPGRRIVRLFAQSRFCVCGLA